jgi:hypothetical protein
MQRWEQLYCSCGETSRGDTRQRSRTLHDNLKASSECKIESAAEKLAILFEIDCQ